MSRIKISADATTDEHFQSIRSSGQQYLAQACRQQLPGPARQRIIQAALNYLETRTSQSSALSHHQASQSMHMSQGTGGAAATATATVRDASFQSYLTSLIDADIPPHALINSSVKAADCQLLPVLIKCLCVLAGVGHILELKSVNGTLVVSQSQYQDHELIPTPVIDVENVNTRLQQNEPLQTAVPPSEDEDGGNNNDNNNNNGGNSTTAKMGIRRTGQNFVDEFVSTLVKGEEDGDTESISGSRPPQCRSSDVFIASVAREVPLSDHAKERVLHLLTERMRQVDIFELPAFIYQLLLFACKKGKDAVKSRVLLKVSEVYTNHEESARKTEKMTQSLRADDEDAIVASGISLKDLREAQGTALYHIDVAARQDPSLSAEVIRLMKSGVENPRHFLTSFGAGIVLLLARSTLLRNDVLPLLREAIAKFDKERANRIDNIFISRVSLNDGDLLDPRLSLTRIAESTCENGWDFVKEGLLELAYVLLDKPLPLLRTTRRQHLAKDLIIKLFESHAMMRTTILQQLQFRIALQEKSAFHSIQIINHLSEHSPSIMLEHQSFIRDCIELLVTLPQWLAFPLMQCFKPFLELRQDLLDFFYLVVRKSLFYRESSTRAVAITGFLTIASIIKAPASGSRFLSQSMSQAPLSQTGGALSLSRVETVVETIQPLRRVFSYPPALRAFLYKKVVNTVQQAGAPNNTRQLSAALGSVLLSHVRRFINVEKAPYLLLDLCVNESAGGAFQEPLGDLIWCLAVLESKRAPDKYHQSHIIDLSKKLAAVSLQDFPVSKATLVSPDDDTEGSQSAQAAALASRNKVRVLGSVIEALIHATLIIPKAHFKWLLVIDVIVPLLILKGKVFELLRNAGAVTPGDTFRDLGGDLELERLRPGARLVFQRGSKSSGSAKKGAGGGRKGKNPGDQSTGGGGTGGVNQNVGHRFGIFSVLTSAHMKPPLSLTTSLDILRAMSEAMGNSQDENNPFNGHENSQDFTDLRVYLLSVAHKHVDDFVQYMSKWTLEEPELRRSDIMDMGSAVEGLARMAMSDFRRFRRASGDAAQGGIKALQIGESCAAALPLLCAYDNELVVPFCKAILTDHELTSEQGVCETAATQLETLVKNLLSESLTKEATTVLKIHDHLVHSIVLGKSQWDKKVTFLDKRGEWALDMISTKNVGDAGIVKTLMHTCLTYTGNNNDFRRGEEICIRLLDVIGDCGNGDEPPEDRDGDERALVNALAVQQETSLSVVDAVCDMIDRGLNDTEWCLGRMVALENALDTQFSADILNMTEGDGQPNEEERTKEKYLHEQTAKLAIRAEDAAQTRLTGVVRVLLGLLRCAIAKWVQQERLLKFVSRTYKLLCTATQAQVKRRGDPRSSFVALVNESKILAPTLSKSYMFIDESTMAEGGGGGTNAAKAKSEGRIKAQVVYDEERFHQQLITAQKKCKVNLLRGMRRNAARDFRIREDKLKGEEEGEEGVGEEENGHGEPSRSNRIGRSSRKNGGGGGGSGGTLNKKRRTS